MPRSLPAPRAQARTNRRYRLLAVATAAATALLLVVMPDARATSPTRVTILRPVTTTGHAAPGYHVVTDGREPVQCSTGSASAVDDGIAFCGSSADYTVSCWRSATPHRVLCLTDVFTRTLRSIRLSGGFPHVSRPHHTRPQGLLLRNGMRFLIRDGGAWDRLTRHPTWVGDYFQRTTFEHSIYGPPNTAGIHRSHAAWRVTIFRSSAGAGASRYVDRVYLVGTRR